MSSRERKRIDDNAGPSNRPPNSNYYHPLQALNDDEKTDDDVMVDSTPKSFKKHIPPITIIKSNIDLIHGLCKSNNVTNYSIRKISIGHKLYCELEYDYGTIMKYLKENKVEYFSYTAKNNRPYKVVLSGLDKIEVSKLKSLLIKNKLEVLDIKPVFKKTQYNRDVILYIVYFKKGSITLKDLREKHQNIEYIKVKWNYQSKQRNKITQCYNCQMYGHGSIHCNVKTFCAKCAGSHSTSSCTSSVTKCANCNGDHSSTNPDCPSRSTYIQLKNRYTKPKHQQATFSFNQQNSSTSANLGSWSNVLRSNISKPTTSSKEDLFSIEQLQSLTLELINGLKNCKTKADQFNVITSIALKFLP